MVLLAHLHKRRSNHSARGRMLAKQTVCTCCLLALNVSGKCLSIYNTPNVKLVIDHKIPVELGGDTTIDNLWTLCSDCNGGKQAFFSDPKAEEVKEIMKMSSASKRLAAYFELYPNVVIEPIKLQSIANVRDWERTLRMVRTNKGMDISWIRPNTKYPMGGYIYNK